MYHTIVSELDNLMKCRRALLEVVLFREMYLFDHQGNPRQNDLKHLVRSASRDIFRTMSQIRFSSFPRSLIFGMCHLLKTTLKKS